MSSTKKHDGSKWQKFGSTKAVDIKITDFSGNFESDNVEGALREASSKISDIQSSVDGQKDAIKKHSEDLQQHAEDIAYLKEHGGGGGGGNIAPTITSKFADGTIVDKGKDVIIPIFFSSPNLGNGTAYIVIDGIEVNSVSVKAGNNNVNIGPLPNLHNEVSIYVKDRIGMLSNQLTWNIIAGGIDLTVDFDSNADYGVTDTILMQFNVTAAGNDPIIMHMTIDYDTYEVQCDQGHNEYIFTGLGVGIHKVSFYITSGNYRTGVTTFNIVVVNAESLYVSSTFGGGKFDYGVPIPIEYRISKMGSEVFDVRLELDDELDKSLSVSAGTYYWTLNDVQVGVHTYAIKVSSAYGEYAEVTGSFEVVEGEYTPLKIIQSGLIYRLSAKGRTNNDSDRSNPRDNSGNGVNATLHNFNYFSNGWIDDTLVCDGNAYVEIDTYPWSENAIYGSTIEIQFKGLDIGIYGSRIFDYTDVETPYKGAYIDLEETTMKSLANTGKINIDADAWITISFVIDRKNKFGKIFVDGICSRAFSLSDTGSGTSAIREDFSHMQKIYLNSRKGIDKFGACEIKDVRVYSRVLSDDEIVQNTIAQIEDLAEQKRIYDLNYNNTTLPTIKMYGDTTKMTLETPVTMRVKYTSPNEDKYGQSFDLPYCQVNWQGTSSLQYVLKNFTVRLKDENMADYYYTPYPNGVPETTFCFKCDYMESTHSRNTGLAKFVNECLYDEKNPAQLVTANVRNSVDGFPILMYINDELQGVYNFNLDRYSTSSYGYTKDTTLVYEVSANSDTTAGAFYKWSEDSGKSKLDYYKSDFECLYPPTRAAGNDDMAELINLVEWVNDSSDEEFKDNISKHFNVQYLLRYFLYVYVTGAVDSLGKNMKLTTWDGLIWYPQVYDADTTIGLDNTGFLKFDMDIEMGDENVFNTTGSKLWKRVQLLFDAELKEQYALMRQKQFTVENLMKYILEEQIQKIPATFYNKDMQTKYLNYGSSYLYALHGSGEHHIRKWLRERLIYCDTLFGYNVSTSDYITLRSSKLGYVYLDIQTYIPMYVRVKWRDEANNTGVQVKRVARGETVRFEYNMPTATDQEIIVYAGYYLKSLGDVSNLQPTSMLIANASRLTEIECHSPNLINTDLSECTKLQRIDLSDSVLLGTGIGAQPILNIQKCKYLRYCNCHNTQLTAVYTMQQGGNLEELYFPKSTQIVQVTNQTYLRVLGIPYYCENLAEVQITNCEAIDYIQYPFDDGDPLDFDTFKYVQNLSITNSLNKLTQMSFSGFSKLRGVTLSSLSKLERLGFDDMLLASEVSTIKNVTISDCPLVDAVSFNVSSNDHKVEFATNGVIDISGLPSCKTIESNYSIKGLNKIILPLTIKNVYLSSDYGDGDNQLTNLWSSTANLMHDADGFTGIDFIGLDLENFRMEGCSNLTTAINFFLTPVNELPNLSAFESLQGWVNFDRYVGDVRYMFKGINFTFENFQVIFNQVKTQTDITGLFQNAIITKAQFDPIIAKFPNAKIFDYFLNGSTIEEDYEFPVTATSVVGAFKDCLNMTAIHSNWETEYTDEIAATDCYVGCINTRLDEVPVDWGGYGLYPEVTTIYEVVIPEDNYTVTIGDGTYLLWNQNEGGAIAWGDGGIADIETYSSSNKTAVSHTYVTAGTYTIKAKFIIHADTFKVTACLKSVLTRVIQEPSSRTNYYKAYHECSNLSEIVLPNGIIPITCLSMFHNAFNLTNVIGIDTWDMSSVANIGYMFYRCALTDYSFVTNWQLNKCTTVTHAFHGIAAETIDISGWNIPKANNLANLFAQSKQLRSINVTGLVKSTVNTIQDFVNGCSNLETIIGMNTWDTSGFGKNAINGAFLNAGNITELDFSNWIFNDVDYGGNYWNGTKLNKLILNNIQWANPTRVRNLVRGSAYDNSVYQKPITVVMDVINPNMTNFDGIFQDCAYVLNDIQLPSNTTSCVNAFKGCTRMTHVHSNWDGEYKCDNLSLTWNVGILGNHANGDNFGQIIGSYTGCRTTNFIEFNSEMVYQAATSVNIPHRIIGYDESQTPIAWYNTVAEGWDKRSGTLTNDTNITSKQIIRYDSDIKYIRISISAIDPSVLAEESIGVSIPSDSCYSGCLGIINIDGIDQTITEVYNPLDGIPKSWGGYGWLKPYTGIYAIEITEDMLTDGVYKFETWEYLKDPYTYFCYKGVTVDWGDGTVESLINNDYGGLTPQHTYTSAGRYIIKGNLFVKRPGQSTVPPCADCLTEVYQTPNAKIIHAGGTIQDTSRREYTFKSFNKLRKVIINDMHLGRDTFNGCSSLEYVDISRCTLSGTVDYFFYNCSNLTTIVGWDTTDLSGIKSMGYFMYKVKVTDIEFMRRIDGAKGGTGELYIANAFNGCSNLTDASPVFENETFRCIHEWGGVFAETAITGDIDLSFLPRDASVWIQNLFYKTNITKVYGAEGLKLKGHAVGAFSNLPLVTEIDLSGIDLTEAISVGSAWSGMVYNCPKLVTLNFTDANLNHIGNTSQGTVYWGYFGMGCPKLENLITTGSTLSNATSFYRAFEGNTVATTVDISSWDFASVTSNLSGYESIFNGWTNVVEYYPPKNIPKNYSVSSSKLSVDSLVRIIDSLMEVSTTQTLTIGAINLAKLTDSQKAVAINKGWTIV